MAEDKNKKEDDKAANKKGLPPLILVAIGAALGGVGTVFMAPKQEPVNANPAQSVPQDVDVLGKKMVEHNFNPRVERGKASAQIKFKFHYVTLDVDKEEADKQVELNWDRMISQTLILLSSQTPEQITAAKNDQYLRQQLRDAMSLSLFPPTEGEKKGVAVVTQILWVKKFVQ